MHIHGNHMNFNQVGLQSGAEAQKAAAAQQAAEVRKQLLKSAQNIGGEVDPEECLMIGRWLDEEGSDHRQGQNRRRSPQQNLTFDEEC